MHDHSSVAFYRIRSVRKVVWKRKELSVSLKDNNSIKKLQPAYAKNTWNTTTISLLSTFLATFITTPLNAAKLLSIENNIISFADFTRHSSSFTLHNLYRGWWTNFTRFAPRHAIEHTVYSILQKCMAPPIAGSLSTTTAIALLYPLDNMHTRRVLCRKAITLSTALQGLFPALVQSSTSGYIWYSTMSYLSKFTVNPLILCGTSALLCNCILHPIDVLKTYCSMHGMNAATATKHLSQKQGFYSGYPIAMATSVAAQAIAYTLFFTLKSHINQSTPQSRDRFRKRT